jgi:hypothetical protein
MVPGCIAKAWVNDDYDDILPSRLGADEFYPEHRYQSDAVPKDILDWMDYRKHLVDVWKSSCKEFQMKFEREWRCDRDSYYG